MAKGFNNRGMRMGNGGINMNMIRQAQKLSEGMQKNSAELENKEYTATAGGGAVSVTVTGKHVVKALTISPAAVDPNEVEMLQDMVMIAVNEANRLADADRDAAMSKLTGGMNLSGLGF